MTATETIPKNRNEIRVNEETNNRDCERAKHRLTIDPRSDEVLNFVYERPIPYTTIPEAIEQQSFRVLFTVELNHSKMHTTGTPPYEHAEHSKERKTLLDRCFRLREPTADFASDFRRQQNQAK